MKSKSIAVPALTAMSLFACGSSDTISGSSTSSSTTETVGTETSALTISPCIFTGNDLNYCLGPVLGPVVVQPVLWTGNVAPDIVSDIVPFYQSLVSSNYFSWLGIYNEGGSDMTRVTLSPNHLVTIQISSANQGAVTIEQVGNELATHFGKDLPSPTNLSFIYAVHMPPGVQVTLDDGSKLCLGTQTGHSGLHTAQSWNGNPFYYYIMGDHTANSGCGVKRFPGVSNNVQVFEAFSTHELVETMTDPASVEWKDLSGAEIGDKCQVAAAGAATITNPIDHTVHSVQYEWDNQLSSVPPNQYTVGDTSSTVQTNSCFTERMVALQNLGRANGVQMSSSQAFVAGNFRGAFTDGPVALDIARVSNVLGLIGIDMFVNNGSGSFAYQPSWGLPPTQGSIASDMPFFAGNFDRDSFADVANAWNNGGCIALDIHENTRSGGFLLTSQAGKGDCFSHGIWSDRWHWVAGDFDGDGMTDIATIWSAGVATGNREVIDLHLATGTVTQFGGFSDVTQAATNIGAVASDGNPPTAERWFAADVDGDGFDDLISVTPGSGSNPNLARVHINNAKGCASCKTDGQWFDNFQPTVPVGAFAGTGAWGVGTFHSGIVGLVEMFLEPGRTNSMAADGFQFFNATFHQQRWASAISLWTKANQVTSNVFVAADLNGDGRTDVADIYGASVNGTNSIVIDADLSQ